MIQLFVVLCDFLSGKCFVLMSTCVYNTLKYCYCYGFPIAIFNIFKKLFNENQVEWVEKYNGRKVYEIKISGLVL